MAQTRVKSTSAHESGRQNRRCPAKGRRAGKLMKIPKAERLCGFGTTLKPRCIEGWVGTVELYPVEFHHFVGQNDV